MIPPSEKLIEMYRKMLEIRQFEEKVYELYGQNLVPGTIHLYAGQEAVAVGVCANLRKEDYIVSTHRGHGHCIAKGADLKRVMAEILGKKTGYCKGKGGSMHIADFSIGILGATGVVGAGIPIAVGAGLSIKLRGTDQVVACFFGDGASNQGTFHEGINMAAIWKLPVLFVCENNLYAMGTRQS
ncbi:MAG TPA: thiamine pyrophosphate-dependent dehydrogenase E1 component subunit alpha, partial [Candidatus Bathyarchaeota archaeon]|nr:thiamine pyrophosphate-dependent dehydrogenase E1 component subunit alpha [Candidatus Bathyarchaeota archaeon]